MPGPISPITTVLTPATATAPAGPYDLTDLATVKDELAIPTSDTSKDGFLQRAITQVSAAVAQYCNRVFAVETIQDLFYLGNWDGYSRYAGYPGYHAPASGG